MILKTLSAALALLICTPTVMAHGNFELLTRDLDKYIMEIRYDPLDSSFGLASPITFYLKEKETDADATYQTIYVKMTKQDMTVFSAPITKPDIGPTSIMYKFPEGGEYQLDVHFQNQTETIADSSFVLKIAPFENVKENQSNTLQLILLGILSTVIGAAIGFFTPKLLKRRL